MDQVGIIGNSLEILANSPSYLLFIRSTFYQVIWKHFYQVIILFLFLCFSGFIQIITVPCIHHLFLTLMEIQVYTLQTDIYFIVETEHPQILIVKCATAENEGKTFLYQHPNCGVPKIGSTT